MTRKRRRRIVVTSKTQPRVVDTSPGQPLVDPEVVRTGLGADADDDFHARVKARVRATGETKTQARLWVHCNVVEPKVACARPGCGHWISDHEDTGPSDVVHRCCVVGCSCHGYVSPTPIVEPEPLPCSDCKLPVPIATVIRCWTDQLGGRSAAEHAGLCCDCFDERLGMPHDRRLVPRPT